MHPFYSAFGFVAATEMKGKLAYAFIFFVAYGIFTATFAFISRGAPAAKDVFVSTLVSLGAVLTVASDGQYFVYSLTKRRCQAFISDY